MCVCICERASHASRWARTVWKKRQNAVDELDLNNWVLGLREFY